MACVFLPVMDSRTVPMDLTRGTVVLMFLDSWIYAYFVLHNSCWKRNCAHVAGRCGTDVDWLDTTYGSYCEIMLSFQHEWIIVAQTRHLEEWIKPQSTNRPFLFYMIEMAEKLFKTLVTWGSLVGCRSEKQVQRVTVLMGLLFLCQTVAHNVKKLWDLTTCRATIPSLVQ